MKAINSETWKKLQERNCEKGKHRLRTNQYGVTWCVICGKLCIGDVSADQLQEEDKLLISVK